MTPSSTWRDLEAWLSAAPNRTVCIDHTDRYFRCLLREDSPGYVPADSGPRIQPQSWCCNHCDATADCAVAGAICCWARQGLGASPGG